ncbi:alpha/beta fold hydrolase [Streptomyces griseosporeus]|uniref:alpha/beta fold hydrolase n=1 Tax=Streptomyces griseosporeus TaxID=1910 RepID=UPI00378B0D10
MRNSGPPRTAVALAALLAGDALLHLAWATGLTWPAPDARALSIAVLGGVVPFTPRVLLPLAALLLATAAAVLARGLGLGGRRLRPVLGAVTLAVAAGLLVRGLVGAAWACGAGDVPSRAFHWLNLLLYTPLCLTAGAAAARLAGVWGTGIRGAGAPGAGSLGAGGRGASRRRRWIRRTALALPLALAGTALYGAYAYDPGEQHGYRSPYLTAAAGSRYLDTPLARFHYVRQGTGSPVVLLSPGASWTFAWHHQVDALSRTHTVYVVDLPGQGFTRLHESRFTWDLDGMTGALGTFLDALGLPRTALGGNSWSGGWALAYAQRHPQRVGRLVLLAPSGLDERDPMTWEALKLPAVGELLVNTGSGRSAAEASLRRVLVHDELITDDLVDAVWAPGTLDANRRAVYRLERGLDWRETEAALPRTRQPVLVVWGRQDTVLPVAQARRFGALLPNATVRELDGCGHALTLDCADRVSAVMEEFLRDR